MKKRKKRKGREHDVLRKSEGISRFYSGEDR